MGKYKKEEKDEKKKQTTKQPTKQNQTRSVFFLMKRAGGKAEFPENYECVGIPDSIILMAWSLSRLH